MPPSNRRHHDDAAEEAQAQPLADHEAPAADGLTEQQSAVLGLSQTIGNRAVARLLQKSGGSPLPGPARQQGEARLGRPVSDDVRVHTGPEAAASAEALQAAAYTVGPDIVFGEAAYAPGTEAGDKLLTHELAHVAQQEQTGVRADPTRLNPRGHASEQQAQAASVGKPTALNAAPAGIARAPGGDEAAPTLAPDAVPVAAPGAPPVAVDEVTAEDVARDAAIDESIGLADTRARTMLNTDYNEVQDAARDFESSTTEGIDSLDAEPSGYLGIASTIVGLAASAISARYHNLPRVGFATSVFSTMFSMGQTKLTADVTKAEDTDPKAAAKSVMHSSAKAIAYAQAAFFGSLRGDLHGQLVKLAQRNPDVADMFEVGSMEYIDQILSEYVGIPNPDTDPLYGPIREAMEVAFADWKTKQERQQKYHWLGDDFGLSTSAAEPGRAAARSRVAAAVAARSGEKQLSWGEQVNNTINSGLNTALTVAFTGQMPLGPDEQPPADVEDTLEPVDEATEAAEQQRERAIQRGVALAETRAREHLNTHYNDVQDAVRDFASSGQEKIDALNGAVSGHWGLMSAVFSGVMTYISTKFPAEAVGKIIKAAAASAAGSAASAGITTAVNDSRSDEKDDATKALRAMATGTANTQAGIFRQAREGLAGELLKVSTGKTEAAETARMLLESGDLDGISAVVEENLGLPDPDVQPLYSEVRMQMEMPFADWIVRQIQGAEEWGHLAQFRTNTTFASKEVAADAALRDADLGSEAPAGPNTFAALDEERVGAEPPAALPPGQRSEAEALAEEDRQVLKRITDVDTRARGFLNNLADEVQDAVRDFVPRALNQTSVLNTEVGDWFGFGNNLLGVAFAALTLACPAIGVGLAIAGAVTGVVAQGVAGYQTDHNASVQQNARIMINGTAKTLQAGYVSTFRTARRALGPALIAAGLTDEETREALLVGGQDNYDYVIVEKLGIPKPDGNSLYLQTRTAMEDEFTTWMTAQLGRDQTAHEKAMKEGQAAAAADDAARRGETGGAAAGKGQEAKKQ